MLGGAPGTEANLEESVRTCLRLAELRADGCAYDADPSGISGGFLW